MDGSADQKHALNEESLTGFKFVKTLLPMLSRLHAQGCARDKSHNRTLHFDNYSALLLLFFFNPIVRSMGGVVQASTLEKVQKELGISPTSKASFSEAPNVFDPDLLNGIVSPNISSVRRSMS